MVMPQQRQSGTDASLLSRFLLGFEGTVLPDELRAWLAQGLGGVAIFRRNWTSVEGLRELTGEIRRAAGRPVLIGIDQEGGTKFSLPEPFTEWPPPAELGRLNDPEAVSQVAYAIARELRAAGCNLNFAPMLDLHMNPESPVTTRRSFGRDPRKVGRMGVAFARGLREGGVLACAKHFPGHGDAAVDPHEDLPVFAGTTQRLESVELVPFAAAVNEGVPLIMTAHILLPRIDAERPASLSRKMLTEVLRQRMGFQGVILADDLGMGAIARRYAAGDAAIAAFAAGSDMAALCHDWSAVRPAIEAVARARERGQFNDAEWQASCARVDTLRGMMHGIDIVGEALPSSLLAKPPLDVIGCAKHRAVADAIRARIAKLPKGEGRS